MVVLAQELEVLAIVIGFFGGEMGAQQFSNPVLRGGGGAKVSDPRFSHFV